MLCVGAVGAESVTVTDPAGDAVGVPIGVVGPNPLATDADLLSMTLSYEDGQLRVGLEAAGPDGVETSPGQTIQYVVGLRVDTRTGTGGGLLVAKREGLDWSFEGTYKEQPIEVTGQAGAGEHAVTMTLEADLIEFGPGSLLTAGASSAAWHGAQLPGGSSTGIGDIDVLDGSRHPLRLPEGPGSGPVASAATAGAPGLSVMSVVLAVGILGIIVAAFVWVKR